LVPGVRSLPNFLRKGIRGRLGEERPCRQCSPRIEGGGIAFPTTDLRLAISDSLSDLIRCLDLAESRPGYTFVALKWFRDVALPGSASAWAQSDAVRSNVLREAIDRRIVVTGRIPNPKSPQFPVTTLKLNRLLPEVRTVLGRGDSMEEGFEPITIRGENLSATVLRERR